MKRLLLFLCLQYVANALFAIPAYRQPFSVIQLDGSALTIRLVGDEHFHYYTTMDNVPVVEDEAGHFYYAMIDSDRIVKSSILAHAYRSRNSEEKKVCKSYAKDVYNYIEAKTATISRQMKSNLKRTRGIKGHDEKSKLEGKRKGLVILVNFANLSMTEADANQRFYDRFNKIGYDEDNHIGSVHDYFYAQSYGALDLSFDVVGPVTLTRNFGYYGKNLDNASDINVRQMVVEACNLVDDIVDFSDYDWKGDGEVEQVYLVYAGYGESYGASSNTIWPHSWSLSNLAIELDGVKIDSYACSCELSGRYGSNINGIGTVCHEFSHCLGLPDLYDTSNGDGVGMGYWDVMCSGSYSGTTGCGEAPCGYSAYERWFFGWLDFEELTDTCRINDIPSVDDNPMAYVIYNDNNRDEFLLLENRQNTGWFSFVGTSNDCHGLLVTHVDYSEDAWKENSVNANSDRQRMAFIPADKDLTCAEPENTLYPGQSGVMELTNESHFNVGGHWNTMNSEGTYSFNAPITNIKESYGLISFDFKGGLHIETPHLHEAEDVTENGFQIHWDFVKDVDSYTVEVVEERRYLSLIDSVLNPRIHVIVDNIVDDKYIFHNLKTAKYKFRIKAVKDGASSSWSDFRYVDLIEKSSIKGVDIDKKDDNFWYNTGGVKGTRVSGVKINPKKGKVMCQ